MTNERPNSIEEQNIAFDQNTHPEARGLRFDDLVLMVENGRVVLEQITDVKANGRIQLAPVEDPGYYLKTARVIGLVDPTKIVRPYTERPSTYKPEEGAPVKGDLVEVVIRKGLSVPAIFLHTFADTQTSFVEVTSIGGDKARLAADPGKITKLSRVRE